MFLKADNDIAQAKKILEQMENQIKLKESDKVAY